MCGLGFFKIRNCPNYLVSKQHNQSLKMTEQIGEVLYAVAAFHPLLSIPNYPLCCCSHWWCIPLNSFFFLKGVFWCVCFSLIATIQRHLTHWSAVIGSKSLWSAGSWELGGRLAAAMKVRWPRGGWRTAQGVRWAISLLTSLSAPPHTVIIGECVLRRSQSLLILQGLMFAKITFRDSVVILQPIQAYLITQIYSIVLLSDPHPWFSCLALEVPSHCNATVPHRAARAAEYQLFQSWRADLCPPKALNHLAQWIRVWPEPNCPTVPGGRDNWVKQVVLRHTNVQERQERGGEPRQQHGALISDQACEACTAEVCSGWVLQ